MISSHGTQAQRWSKATSLSLVAVLLLVHAACLALVIVFCPAMFVVDKYQGGHCETRQQEASDAGGGLASCTDCETSSCVAKSEGERVALSNIMMSFKFPRDQQTVNVWNWRLTASLSIYLRIFENDLVVASALPQQEDSSDNITNDNLLVNLESFDQTVTLSSSLDYALNENLAGAVDPSTSAWHSKARLRHVNRTLRCRSVADHEESETSDSTGEQTFLCVLTPLLELFPLSNSTYITSVQVELLADSSSPVNLVNTNATLVTYLSTVTESQRFHQARFYAKCVFSPLLLVALVWFLVRLCMNDLYITIPDRLVITTALAHLLNNLPVELAVIYLPWPQLLVAGQLTEILSFSTLALFWIVFTLDKLADNEPWERTTRYYWRCIGLVVTGCLVGVLTVLFLDLPSLHNPLATHWRAGPTTFVALGLLLSLAVSLAAFQTYLAILVFRVICDISVHYPTTSRAWRLKGVLVYNFVTSLLLSLALILRLVSVLVLHWNPDFPTDPVPFGISGAGPLLLLSHVAGALHVVFLLLALSRTAGGEGGEGWYAPVRPVMYSPVERREEQLHLWDLSAHPSPLHKLDT